jgi:hypothetical protein
MRASLPDFAWQAFQGFRQFLDRALRAEDLHSIAVEVGFAELLAIDY